MVVAAADVAADVGDNALGNSESKSERCAQNMARILQEKEDELTPRSLTTDTGGIVLATAIRASRHSVSHGNSLATAIQASLDAISTKDDNCCDSLD